MGASREFRWGRPTRLAGVQQTTKSGGVHVGPGQKGTGTFPESKVVRRPSILSGMCTVYRATDREVPGVRWRDRVTVVHGLRMRVSGIEIVDVARRTTDLLIPKSKQYDCTNP